MSFNFSFANLILGFLAGTFLGWLFYALFKKKYAQRIARIAETATRYIQGTFDQPPSVEKDPEIRTLANTMNQMAATLKARIIEAEGEKAKISAILNHMEEGVIAVGSRKEVLVMNPTAQKILGFSAAPVLGKSLLEVIRNQRMEGMIDRAMEGKTLVAQEMELSYPGRKVLRVNAVGISSGKEVAGILVLYDISEVRKLENMRREFVATVSHELRTPLTSIKGFIETLLGGALRDPERSETFLKMMQEDAARLARLIDDLLELSKLESHQVRLHLEPLSLKEELEKVIAILSPRLEEKKMTIENQVMFEKLPRVLADSDKLKQVLVNLLDNAIKFNREGGRITIRAEEVEKTRIRISIEDTGIGIPRDAISRIFERFYRVDKARSREEGGTGLGLAIVKHIVEAHGGNVSCRSEAGKGALFIFTLPSYFPPPFS